MNFDPNDHHEHDDGRPKLSTSSPMAGTTDNRLCQEPTYGRRAGKSEIWVALGVVSIPLFIVSGLLLGIIFTRRVRTTESASSALSFNVNEDESNAYYIQISSTTLVLLASFSSTIASIIVGFVMTLLAYPVSRHLLRSLQLSNTKSIPKLYQLGLLITLLNASGLAVLWRWAKYIIARPRHKVAGVLNTAGCGLVMANVFLYSLLSLMDR